MNSQESKVQNISFQTKDGVSARLSSLLEAPEENVLSCFFRLLEHPCMSWLVVLHCLQSFSYLIPLILTSLTPFSTIWVSCDYNVPTSDQKNNSYLNVSLLATFASEKTFIPKQMVIFIGYSNQHVDTYIQRSGHYSPNKVRIPATLQTPKECWPFPCSKSPSL